MKHLFLSIVAALLAASWGLNAQTLQSGSFLTNLPELKTATKTADGIYDIEIQPLQVTDPSTNQTVEYALNETGDFYDPAATVWQDSPVFPAHATTGAVYLLARSKKNATHAAGVIYHHAVYLDGKCNCSLGLTLPPIVPPAPVGSVSLNKTALTLAACQSEQLTATVLPANAVDKTVTWATSDASIATVSTDGTITAVAAGTATITATAGEKTATCTVTVPAPFTISGATSTFACTSCTLTLTASGTGTTNWASSDTDLATVTASGLTTTVTPKAPGTVTVTASRTNGGCTTTATHTLTITALAYPTFAPTNLGADPQYDTPKKQMAYLATAPESTATNNGAVFGGRYQWGRGPSAATGDYAISEDGNYTLYNGATKSAALGTSGVGYDDNGQITSYNGTANNAIGNHVSTTTGQNFNWAYYWKGNLNALWGNGEAIDTATPGGVPSKNGNFYQKPVKTINDPCPAGWRVPTQDEWEHLVNYDCASQTASIFLSIPTTQVSADNNNGLTWVRVLCNGGTSVPCVGADWSRGKNSGYAVYRTSVWNGMTASDRANLSAATAPEPFLFLPAAGYRNSNGTETEVLEVGTFGNYWSSTVRGTNTYRMSFYNLRVQTEYSTTHRAIGGQVRCVKE